MAKKRKLRKRIQESQNKCQFNQPVEDRHHLLWQAAHYGHGYAKMLRIHPWLIMLIPRDTLHHEIHSKIGDIPVPNDELCKAAYLELVQAETEGLLDYGATAEYRIDWLLNHFTIDNAPLTYLALINQRDVIHSFYQRIRKD